ncbi:MAG TPA: DUF559 domain-containing protein, partial [Solirubrobacteraceae bacterium]|nr:DUF559 domain-containing protein [Solirubrobacteraceae bacterium]
VSLGRMHRLHQGVYALTPPALLRPHGRRLAAVLACGPGAALSHRAAADLHGLLPYKGSRLDVTVPTGADRRRPNIHIHRSRTLAPANDVMLIDRIPTTTPARTLLDLAAILPPNQLDRALDQAITLNLFDLRALRDQLHRNTHRGRNAHNLRRALEATRLDALPSWNRFEDRFLTLIRQAGLPEPEIQPTLDLHDGEPPIRPDFLWRAEKLIVETDGWRFHGGPTQFQTDRRRDQRAAAAGFQTLRVTWDQLTDEPTRLISTVRAAATSTARSALSAWAA